MTITIKEELKYRLKKRHVELLLLSEIEYTEEIKTELDEIEWQIQELENVELS